LSIGRNRSGRSEPQGEGDYPSHFKPPMEDVIRTASCIRKDRVAADLYNCQMRLQQADAPLLMSGVGALETRHPIDTAPPVGEKMLLPRD
jgi:hypothetical protein